MQLLSLPAELQIKVIESSHFLSLAAMCESCKTLRTLIQTELDEELLVLMASLDTAWTGSENLDAFGKSIVVYYLVKPGEPTQEVMMSITHYDKLERMRVVV